MPNPKPATELPDIMTGTVENCRYVTSNFARGRRLVFYGVGMYLESKNGKIRAGVSYPCLGPLARLVEKHKDKKVFKWNGKKWRVEP